MHTVHGLAYVGKGRQKKHIHALHDAPVALKGSMRGMCSGEL